MIILLLLVYVVFIAVAIIEELNLRKQQKEFEEFLELIHNDPKE